MGATAKESTSASSLNNHPGKFSTSCGFGPLILKPASSEPLEQTTPMALPPSSFSIGEPDIPPMIGGAGF